MKVEITDKDIQQVFSPIFVMAEKAYSQPDLLMHSTVQKALTILRTPIKEPKKITKKNKKKGR